MNRHDDRAVTMWVLLGIVYYAMEGAFHILTNGGWAWVGMLPIGGLCGLLIGRINQIPAFYRRAMWLQCLAGAAAILAVEFASGCVVNLWWGWGIWDYSHIWGNAFGQICLPFAAIWYLLTPTAIWLEDALRWHIWGEGDYYTLRKLYAQLFTGR